MGSPARPYIGLLAALLGCSSFDELPLGSTEQQIELTELDRLFALSTQLLSERTAVARERERASLATGALLVPFVNPDGSPATASNGVNLRATCGATFVSPSFAITAAHCVDGARMNTDRLTMRMFRPTLRLAERFRSTTSLEGSFPNYRHGRLTADDGYLFDDFDCALVARCAAEFGGWFGCNALQATGEPSDVALIQCTASPGSRYGTALVATVDDRTAEVFLPWKHEIYDVPLDPEDDRFQHYSRHYDDPGQNYHYFGRALDGSEHHQLLPLMSVPFGDGAGHRKLNETSLGTMTDLFGCHGTSGSGVWQRTARGEFELLGPVVYGNHELESYLCDHTPSYDGFSRTPGSLGLTYGSLEATRTLLGEYATSIGADCATTAEAMASPFVPLPCGLQRTTAPQVQLVDVAHPLTLQSAASQDRGPWRIGFTASCVGDCGSLRVTIDGATIVQASLASPSDTPRVFGAAFVSAPGAPGLVVLAIDGTGTARIEDVAVRKEGQANEFDTAAERADVHLCDTSLPVATVSAIRSEGNSSGFAARIEPGERLVFTRQALIPEHATSLRFESEGEAALFCGLLAPAGTELERVDCSTGFARLGPKAGSPVGAFFIENAHDSPAALVDGVRVVSDLMPDSDRDGVPDLLDDCTHGPAPSFYPTEACCSADQRRVLGRADDELFDYSSLGPICAITGGGGDLVISGDGSNYVAAGADGDYVSSCGQEDVLLGGDGDDYLRACSYHAVVHGGPGDDTIHATGAGAAELYGGAGRDVIVGSDGSDTIAPGSGGDWVDAGAGDDTVVIRAPCEVASGLELHGGLGTDVLRTAMNEAMLREAGVVVDGFETILVDDSLAYLADCNQKGTTP